MSTKMPATENKKTSVFDHTYQTGSVSREPKITRKPKITREPKRASGKPKSEVMFDDLLTSLFIYYDSLYEKSEGMPKLSSIDLMSIRFSMQSALLVKVSSIESSILRAPLNSYDYQVVGIKLRDALGLSDSLVSGSTQGQKQDQTQGLAEAKKAMEDNFKIVEKKKKPHAYVGTVSHAKQEDGSKTLPAKAQVMLLPFSNDGKDVDHILGVISY